MGKASRAKRERREGAAFAAGLTASEGSWLERPIDLAEQARIAHARRELGRHRSEGEALLADYDELIRYSLEVFRDPRFAVLHFDDWVIESVLDKHGEPPVVERDDDPAFSDYLRAAVVSLASSQVRRAMAEQVRRFLPQYVEEGNYRAAFAIEHNAYMTVMSDASTPLLVQMLVGGLARWYDADETADDAMGA